MVFIYLGSISVLLRGQAAFGRAVTMKMARDACARVLGMFFFSFIYLTNNRYRHYNINRQHLHLPLPRQTATTLTNDPPKKSTKRRRNQ